MAFANRGNLGPDIDYLLSRYPLPKLIALKSPKRLSFQTTDLITWHHQIEKWLFICIAVICTFFLSFSAVTVTIRDI